MTAKLSPLLTRGRLSEKEVLALLKRLEPLCREVNLRPVPHVLRDAYLLGIQDAAQNIAPASPTGDSDKGPGASVADIARTGPLPRPETNSLPVGKEG